MPNGTINAHKIPDIFNKNTSVKPYAVSFGFPFI